jgi:DNA replication protein DnaC/transposase
VARRTFDVIDLVEIYEHWYAGRSQVQIAASLGIDRKTVRKYLAPVEAEHLVPGGPPAMREADWRAKAVQWFPQVADAGLRQVTWPAIAVHRDYIRSQLAAGVTVATIHQRLVDEHALAASVASVRRWVAANLPEEARRAQVRVLRPAPAAAGQEAQIDYGRLGRWVDPATGRAHTVWAFVMVLACSRHMFVRPVLRMDQAAWTGAHVEAFAFFGGVPARLIPDNLKTGVDKPDLYDPRLNRCYAELAVHYDTLIDPARAGKPTDKPRVERPMPYVRDSFWRGRTFTCLEQMRAEAVRWCRDVAGRRACRPLEGAAPAVVFAAVEAPALRPLPAAPFVLATWSAGKVGPDIHVKVGAALYSVPWRLIGQRVEARSTTAMVQIIHHGNVVATHVRAERGRRTTFEHYPPEKIAFHMRTPTWCRQHAARVGPACAHVIEDLLAVNALFRLRAAQGVLRLADKHGTTRLEAACATATAVGDPSYRTIKAILAAGTETTAAAFPGRRAAAVPAFLRGPDQLFTTEPERHGLADVVRLPPSPEVERRTSRPSATSTGRPAHERPAAAGPRPPGPLGDGRRAGRRPRRRPEPAGGLPAPGQQRCRRRARRLLHRPPTESLDLGGLAGRLPRRPGRRPARSHPRRRHRRTPDRRPVMSVLEPALHTALRALKLTGMLETLDSRLAQARAGQLGHLDFLQVLCVLSEDEIARRDTAALTRRVRRARFEEQATLETFDFTANPKASAAALRDLAALRWLAAAESVILYGPVGVGKTHIAQGLGHNVIRRGGEVRFIKTSRLLADLAGGHADHTWDRRLREYTRPAVLILDDFAMRALTDAQADDLYELISERATAARPLIVTSNRAPTDWYPLFPNPVVAESLLDRLINNSHQILMDGPSYRPRKRPRPAGSTTTRTAE